MRRRSRARRFAAPGTWLRWRTLETGIFLMGEAGYASEHDQKVARWAAYILCGGRVTAGTPVSEQYLLDLEREAFLSLCGERKTQERIAFTLKTGKPLRNWQIHEVQFWLQARDEANDVRVDGSAHGAGNGFRCAAQDAAARCMQRPMQLTESGTGHCSTAGRCLI